MRTVTFQSILDRIAGYMAEADGLSSEDAAVATAKINLFIRLGWQYYWWPETMLVEKRTFRAAYDPTQNYAAAVEVFNPADCQYYQTLQAVPASANQPPALLVNGGYVANAPYWAVSQANYGAADWAPNTAYVSTGTPSIVRNPSDGLYYQCIISHTSEDTFDPSAFGLLTPFVRSIDYEQTGETPLGLVRFLWDRDPDVYAQAQEQPFRLRNDFVQVLGCRNVVWTEFQGRAPVFTNVIYNSAAGYSAGVTLYDRETGDCWESLVAISPGDTPTVSPSKWEKIEFPYVLAEFVAQSAYAMMTNREQQIPENFTIQQAAGYPLLLAELDNIERKQGQTRQLSVRSGRGGVALTPYTF